MSASLFDRLFRRLSNTQYYASVMNQQRRKIDGSTTKLAEFNLFNHHHYRYYYYYYLDVVLLVYSSTELSSGMYEMLHDYPGQHDRHNPTLYFIRRHQSRYGPFVTASLFLYAVFHFGCLTLRRIGVQPQLEMWQASFELNVAAVQYYWCAAAQFDGRQKLLATVRRRTERELWRRWYSAAVRSTTVRRVLRPAIRPVIRWHARLLVWLRMDHVDKRWLVSRPFVHTHCSSRLRLKLIRRAVYWNVVVLAVQLAIGFAFFAFFCYITVEVTFLATPTFAWYSYVWFLTDMFFVGYSLTRMIRCSMLFVGCALVELTYYVHQLAEHLDAVIVATRHECGRKKTSRKNLTSTVATRAIATLLATHRQVAVYVHVANTTVYGPLILLYLATNLPVNVYLVAQLTFARRQLSPIDWLISGLTFAMQCAATGCVFALDAWFYARVHRRLVAVIPAVQLRLDTAAAMMQGNAGGGACPPRNWTLVKLRLDDLLKRALVGRPKLAATIGPLKPITPLVVFELIAFYVGSLLMAFSWQIQSTLGRRHF